MWTHHRRGNTACELLVSPQLALWAALPLCPLGQSFWEISREIPWKGTDMQGERLSSQEVICAVELSFQLVAMVSNTSAEKR